MSKQGIVEVSAEEYASQAPTLPGYNFMQAAPIGSRRTEDGWRVHYLLYFRDDELRGAALLNGWSYPLGLTEYECTQGPLADYESEEFDGLLVALGDFVRQKGGVSLRINPPILANHRDIDANVVDDGYSGETYVRCLDKLGYQHIPNDQADKNDLWLRWYFVKDMTPYGSFEEVMKSVDSQTRWSLNKARRFGVVVEPAETETEVQAIIDLHLATGERRGFNARDARYYQGMLRAFPESQRLLVGAYLDVDAYAKNLASEGDALARELADVGEDASAGKIKDIETRIEGNHQKQAEVEELHSQATDGRILLAGSFFFHVGDELIYLTSSSDERYKSFYGPYAIQEWAMTYAIQHQIPRYNFYGTKGSFMGLPSQDGIYHFKRGFGGVIEEQIGYFVLTTRPIAAKLLQLMKRLRG